MPDSSPHAAGIEFALLLGEALHRYGTPAHRLEATLTLVCERLGIESRFVATPTALFASFGPASAMQSTMVRVEPGDMDLGKLAELDTVSDAVAHSRMSVTEGALSIGHILASPPPYLPFMTLISYGVAAASTARLLGGGWREIAVATASSLIIGVLSALSSPFRSVARVVDAVGALASSALATLAAVYWAPVSVSVATLSGVVVLLPGLSLTVAMNELANRHLISGTAKLMNALLTFLKLGFGVALGSRLGTFLPPVPELAAAPMLPLWTEPAALVLLTAAVCVLLKARPRDFGYISVAGALGYLAARWGTSGFGLELGAFFGTLILGAVSNALARWRNAPSVVTVVPGLILLVPGSVGFRSLESLLQRDVLAGVGTGFTMVMVAVGLVAGLLFANALVPSRRVL